MDNIYTNNSEKGKIAAVSDLIARSRVPSWKRVLDCTLILLAAPVWLPLGVLIAAWVKLVSPGPALFRQERIGHMGARFLCLKFRTMKVNADTTVHREHLNHLMTSNRPMKKLDATGDCPADSGRALAARPGLGRVAADHQRPARRNEPGRAAPEHRLRV